MPRIDPDFELLMTGEDWPYALEVIQHQSKWLEHCSPGELSPEHRRALIEACGAFYNVLRPLVAHYIDGEEIESCL